MFPNRLALIFLVLLAALGAGLAASFAMAQVLPTFHAVAALREFTQRPVLGSVSILATKADLWRKRVANVAFAGGLAILFVACGVWVTCGIDEHARLRKHDLNTIEQAASRLAQLRNAGVDAAADATR